MSARPARLVLAVLAFILVVGGLAAVLVLPTPTRADRLAQPQIPVDGAIGVFTHARGVSLRAPSVAGEVADGALAVRSTRSASAALVRLTLAGLGRETIAPVAPAAAPARVVGGAVATLDHGEGVTQEFRAATAGLRHDVVIARRPAGSGELRCDVAVEGAEVLAGGDQAVRLLLANGHELTYDRLLVTDADGRRLPARMLAMPGLVRIVVDDHGSRYPVRIDPTISDSDWSSFGVARGFNGAVRAMIRDGQDLIVGGDFTAYGAQPLRGVARWNGASWQGIGGGVNGSVRALGLLAGGILVVGGEFEGSADGTVVSRNLMAHTAADGWQPIDGPNGNLTDPVGFEVVHALAGVGTSMYVGGDFDFTTPFGDRLTGLMRLDLDSETFVGGGGAFFARVRPDQGWTGAPRLLFHEEGPQVSVRALAKIDDHLWIGGRFHGFTDGGAVTVSSANVVRLDLTVRTWQGLDVGVGIDQVTGIPTGEVSAILGRPRSSQPSEVYIGGWFETSRFVSLNHFAQWDPQISRWVNPVEGIGVSPPSSFNTIERIQALGRHGDAIYVHTDSADYGMIDDFYNVANSRWGNGILRVDLNQPRVDRRYETTGIELDGPVYAMLDHDGQGSGVLISGRFAVLSPGLTSPNLMRLDSGFRPADQTYAEAVTSFSPPPPGVLGPNRPITATVVAPDGTLYVGGLFTAIGGVEARHVARWTGTGWAAVGDLAAGTSPTFYGGIHLGVRALALDRQGRLYAGGYLRGGAVRRWDGTQWSGLGTGLAGVFGNVPPVYSLAVDGRDHLFAGGSIQSAGGVPARGVARWDGTVWHALSNGVGVQVGGYVYAMLATGSGDLVVGGAFTGAGTAATAANIARWDGSAWSAMPASGPGLGTVRALIEHRGQILLGQQWASGREVLRWSEAARDWQTVGFPGGEGVRAFASLYQDLYVGGDFVGTGARVLQWDGATWAALGSGIDAGVGVTGRPNSVPALATTPRGATAGRLYVGGGRISAGAVLSAGIAAVGLGGPPPNTPPVIGAIPSPLQAAEHQLFTLAVPASDADLPPQILEYRLIGAPLGMRITTAGEIRWTPGELQGGTTSTFQVAVSDGITEVFRSLTISVIETNENPLLAPIAEQVVESLTAMRVPVSATDADVPSQVLTFSIASGSPAATIVPTGATAAEVRWTPGQADVGPSNLITVRVEDGAGGSATRAFNVRVYTFNLGTNTPPQIAPVPDQQATEHVALTFTPTATDPEVPATQTLTWSLGNGAPAGATIDAVTGRVDWTPGETHGGTAVLIPVQVADGVIQVTRQVRVDVAETNERPVIGALAPRTVLAGSDLLAQATASDADLPAQQLRFTLDQPVPAGAAISATGAFTWRPSASQAPATWTIVIRVDDQSGAPNRSATTAFAVTVAPPVDPAAYAVTHYLLSGTIPAGVVSVISPDSGVSITLTGTRWDAAVPADRTSVTITYLGAGGGASRSTTFQLGRTR